MNTGNILFASAFSAVAIATATTLAEAPGIDGADAKASALAALVGRVEKAEDIDAVGFKEVKLDGVVVDFIVSSDDVAVLFAVYPEDCDYVAVAREKEKAPLASNELSATKLDVLTVQRELVKKLEKDADVHLAIIASANTLLSMKGAWGDELQRKGIELVGYRDFESHLRKYLPLFEDDSDEDDASVYGLDASHPVCLVNVDAEYAYLRRLKNKSGKTVRALRWGSFYADGFAGPLDRWSVEREPGVYVDLFIYPYSASNTLDAPEGFTLDNFRIEDEFAHFAFSPPAPREENEPAIKDHGEAPAVSGRDETVRVGPIVFPPPRGFVDLSSRPALYARYLQMAGDSHRPDVVFGKSADGRTLEAFVYAFCSIRKVPHISLEAFQQTMAKHKSSLYDSGPSAGVFAPHRTTERSLQWSKANLSYNGNERVVAVSSAGDTWICGQVITMAESTAMVPVMEFRMFHIEQSRKLLEDWEDAILRANGIDPATASRPDILEKENEKAKHEN